MSLFHCNNFSLSPSVSYSMLRMVCCCTHFCFLCVLGIIFLFFSLSSSFSPCFSFFSTFFFCSTSSFHFFHLDFFCRPRPCPPQSLHFSFISSSSFVFSFLSPSCFTCYSLRLLFVLLHLLLPFLSSLSTPPPFPTRPFHPLPLYIFIHFHLSISSTSTSSFSSYNFINFLSAAIT